MSEIHAHPAGEWPCLGAVDTGKPALVLLQSLPSFPEPVTTLSNLDHNVLESDSQDGRARMVIYGGLSSRGVDIFPDSTLQSPVAVCYSSCAQGVCSGTSWALVDTCPHRIQQCREKIWARNFPFCSSTWDHESEHSFSPLKRQDLVLFLQVVPFLSSY